MATLVENPVIGLLADETEIHEIIELDHSGDSRMQWDRNNPESVAAAKARFDGLKAKGHLAYKVDKSGGQGEVLQDFDPDAERIIMAARMIGG